MISNLNHVNDKRVKEIYTNVLKMSLIDDKLVDILGRRRLLDLIQFSYYYNDTNAIQSYYKILRDKGEDITLPLDFI